MTISQNKISSALLLALYALLYYPYPDFPLSKIWMYIGLGLSLSILFATFLFKEYDSAKTDLRILASFILLLYTIHQFEEHGIDIFNEKYAFMGNFNALFHKKFSYCGDNILCPLNEMAIFYVNTSVVWLTILLAILAGDKNKCAAIGAISVMSVNAVAHIMPSIFVTHEYNPGLFTAIILFIPYSIFYYRKLLRHYNVPKHWLILGALWALVMHAFIVASALMIFHMGYCNGNGFVYLFGCVIVSFMPFVAGIMPSHQEA